MRTFLRTSLDQIRWRNAVLFGPFLVGYAMAVSYTISHDSLLARVTIHVLATVPGVVFGLMLFRVIKVLPRNGTERKAQG